jgi:adhesin transport system outer membrane protein
MLAGAWSIVLIAAAPAPPPALPLPGDNPMTIDFAADPVLAFATRAAPADQLRATVAQALVNRSTVQSASATRRRAAAAVQEARAGWRPQVDVQLSYNRRLSAGFSDAFDTLLERSRPVGRTDATLTASQNLFDFGAASRRIDGAKARRDQAQAQLLSAQDDAALAVIAAWYDVATYRALVAASEGLLASQRQIRAAIDQRIYQGASAQGDLSRVDAVIGRTMQRLGQYRGEADSAAERYRLATGVLPAAMLDRPGLAPPLPLSIDAARLASANSPEVLASKARERAARADWKSVAASNLPNLSAQVNAGRYGVFENERDYDVRGLLVLRHRLTGGGGGAREDQALEQYRAAQADAQTASEQAQADAAEAFATLAALDEQVRAAEAAYRASRISRDVLHQRFIAYRGTLFDLLTADEDYLNAAISYLSLVTRRDAQKLVLLRRCGALLDGLAIARPETGL